MISRRLCLPSDRNFHEIEGITEREPFSSYQTGSFIDRLRQVINRHSLEGVSDTPDYILAEYLTGCLDQLTIKIYVPSH